MCVCSTHLFSFFPLAFFSGFSLFFVLEMRSILFLFLLPFVSFCCRHLYFTFTAMSYQMFFLYN